MERFEKTTYIIRFSEGNEIKTLKVGDDDTLKYIVDKLEMEFINYVIIKEQENCYRHIAKALLDYQIGGVE